jgi:phosphomannomutase
VPETIGGRRVTAVGDLSVGVRRSLDGGADSVIDLPPSDVITLHMDGARIVIRPSGTEPKLKVYFEVVVPVRYGMPTARQQADRELASLRSEMELLTGL